MILLTPDDRIRPSSEPGQAGDLVLCENGHIVGECIKDVTPFMVNTWGDCFKIYSDPNPTGKLAHQCLCRRCGGSWFVAVHDGEKLKKKWQAARSELAKPKGEGA